MKVISTKSISFPKLKWGISQGEVKELPEDKEAQERILQEIEITLVESVSKKEIKLYVIDHKDRLSRFGFEFIEWFCNINDCQIEIINNPMKIGFLLFAIYII